MRIGRIMVMATLSAVAMCGCSKKDGEVTIRLPKDYKEATIVVSHAILDNLFTAKSADEVNMVYDTLEVKDGIATLRLDPAGAAWYDINPPVMTRVEPEFYASLGETLEVVINSFDPLDYAVSGTPLMDDLTTLYSITRPIQMEHMRLLNIEDSVPTEQLAASMMAYDGAIKKFVADHPDSHAIAIAITDLSGDDFKAIYDNMSPEARKSILMPYAESYNRQVEDMLSERAADEAKKAEVASGTIKAPDFTLPDLAGKKVSLSDFKGKWVVLDFWGSWCGWCVKGFPALREAYEKYGDKIVVIGIDCNESEEEWRAGVKKHNIPWLNLYNGNDTKLYTDYGIEGFPTKAIINPEGYIVDLTTGEDPSFYERLASFVK